MRQTTMRTSPWTSPELQSGVTDAVPPRASETGAR
jgi:hypothetical protein